MLFGTCRLLECVVPVKIISVMALKPLNAWSRYKLVGDEDLERITP